jgi:hypothetical protein
MEVSTQLHASAALPKIMILLYKLIGGWIDLKFALDIEEEKELLSLPRCEPRIFQHIA